MKSLPHLLILSLFLNASCSKNDKIKAEITAVSNHSGNGIRLKFYYQKIEGGGPFSQANYSEEILPSSFKDGVNYINTEIGNHSSIKAYIYKTSSYSTEALNVPIVSNRKVKATLYVDPLYIKSFEFNNVNCQGETDTLIMVDNYNLIKISGCNSVSLPGYYNGVYTGYYAQFGREKNLSFTYKVVRNGITTEHQFNQELEENSNNKIVINY